ncbi:GerMN domain-containing protein [Kribbella sp. NPDC000426]|uniref:GerMN domain-containing protein n=1 Tax=Kribbella sp. NPDC000426 TaxID=3154255 RepID=UPI003333F60E
MRALVTVLAAAVVLAGCGVPVQQQPAPIDPAAVPSRLLRGNSPTSGPSSATPGKPAIQVVLVRNDRLVTLVRDAPKPAPSDRLQTVISALLAGPTTTEQADGITSALPPELTLAVAGVQGQVVHLELSGETDGRSATENVLAVGQIVLSVTALSTVDQVTFSRNGQPVEALLADGALTTDPLTAADYAVLRSR